MPACKKIGVTNLSRASEKMMRGPNPNPVRRAQVPESLIRVLPVESSVAADLLNGADYRRRVGRVVGAWEKLQYRSREGEDGHSE